jgi:hypothetical protein
MDGINLVGLERRNFSVTPSSWVHHYMNKEHALLIPTSSISLKINWSLLSGRFVWFFGALHLKGNRRLWCLDSIVGSSLSSALEG